MKNQKQQQAGNLVYNLKEESLVNDLMQKNNQAENDQRLHQEVYSRILSANSKIGRRYSFDDNGGGYQGL